MDRRAFFVTQGRVKTNKDYRVNTSKECRVNSSRECFILPACLGSDIHLQYKALCS